jgi:hypothetical protein
VTDKHTESIIAKLVGAGAAFAAALVVQKVVALAWKAKTGHRPPAADDQGDAGLAEVVAAAAITGALVAMSRVLATRGTARFAAKVD